MLTIKAGDQNDCENLTRYDCMIVGSVMKMFSKQFPIEHTNSGGHTTVIEGPDLFCKKVHFNSPKKPL